MRASATPTNVINHLNSTHPVPEIRAYPRSGVCLSHAMEPIGTMIREELERHERSISWFARKLSCDRSNVYRLFQKHSIDTALLMRISVVLGRDFFAELSRNLPQQDDTRADGVSK